MAINDDDYDDTKNVIGQAAYTKTKAILTNSLNLLLIAAKKLIPKNHEKFPKIPG